MNVAEEKQNLRQSMIEQRRSMEPRLQEDFSRRICERIKDNLALEQYLNILFYYPAPGEHEVDLRPLFEMAFEQLTDVQCLLPRVLPEDNRIHPHVIPDSEHKNGESLRSFYSLEHSNSPLEKGTFGIPEPVPEQCPLVEPSSLDLVFTPGLAFDREGYRVGYGGGYYDRLFQRLESGTELIGVCYDFQLVDRCPRDSHDVPVDRLVTEQEFIPVEDD